MNGSIDAVVDKANSELKYWGGDHVGLLHLAIAVAKESPEVFDAAFGAEGLDVIKSHLSESRFGTEGPAEVELVLDGARAKPSNAEALGALTESLRMHLEWAFVEGENEGGVTDPVGGSSHTAGRGDAEAATRSAEDRPGGVESSAKDRFLDLGDCAPESPERTNQVDELVVMLARRNPQTPLLIGREGSGRTRLLESLAARLSDKDYKGPLAGTRVVVPDAELKSAPNLAYLVTQAAESWGEPTIVCLEDLELLLDISGYGIDASQLSRLRPLLEHPQVHLVFSIDEALLGRFESYAPEFRASLTDLDVPLRSAEMIRAVVSSAAEELAGSHGVDVSREIVDVAVDARPGILGAVQPGLGISIIDSACVRAMQRGAGTVEIHDLSTHGSRGAGRVDHDGLTKALKHRVMGQDQVVDGVASRLALTKAGLDLRPERPDGVFLFVGPTGVGKTEMARAISREIFGDEERMIRLDMSEYVHDWAVSRLIGPQPGYVGSTEPGSWLTTRVAKNPACVLLLDEIEKAHPVVWNTFLQVFDSGRLTDSRGETADFSDVVVIMTSNLGAEAYSRRQIGFGQATNDVDQAEAEVSETIRRTLSPELINRLDDILLFKPLGSHAIRAIARQVVDAQVRRIAALGIQLHVGDEVVEHLATTGYDAAFGARHLQRNVDSELLVPLALAGDGSEFTAHLSSGTVQWEPT